MALAEIVGEERRTLPTRILASVGSTTGMEAAAVFCPTNSVGSTTGNESALAFCQSESGETGRIPTLP